MTQDPPGAMTAEQAVVRMVGSRTKNPDALRRLAILLDGLAEGLMTPQEVAEFFDDLAADWTSNPADRWFDVWERVCRGSSSAMHRAAGYLRLAANETRPPALPMTTTVLEVNWRRFHLRPKTEQLCEEGFAFPEFPLARDPSSRDRFRAMTARPGWYRAPTETSGAWLGRPASQRANCWVSTRSVSAQEGHEPAWADDVGGTLAALGISPASPGESGVRYILDPGELETAGHGLGVRPGFADLGSSWFRILAVGREADRHRSHGWGSTMHLAHNGRPVQETTGLPERVVSSVPLDSPAVVDSELLLPASPGARQPAPSQKEFDQMLMRGRKPSAIVRGVLSTLRRSHASVRG